MQRRTNKAGCLLIRAVSLALVATTAAAQWRVMDRSAPHADETCAAALYQIKRWDRAILWYGKALKKNPENAFGWYFLSHALLRKGELGRAIAIAEKASTFPQVKAHALYVRACAHARSGEGDRAMQLLRQAAEAQYVAPKGHMAKDEDLRSLRSRPGFHALAKASSSVQARFAQLADADNKLALTQLWRSNEHTWWPNVPTNLNVLKSCLEERMKWVDRAGDRSRKQAELLATRARRGAAAADNLRKNGRFREYVNAILALDGKQRKAYRSYWRRLEGMNSMIRSHRFDRAIRAAGEILAAARKNGDLAAMGQAHYAAGLSHIATVDHKQPRKGVSTAEELRLSAKHYREVLSLATAFGDMRGIVDGTDFLATIDNMQATRPAKEIVPALWRGIILSCRLAPEKRELGMWERMWRKTLENAERKAATKTGAAKKGTDKKR